MRTSLCTTNLLRCWFLFPASSISASTQWFVKKSIGWGFSYSENIIYMIYPLVSQVACIYKRGLEATGLLQPQPQPGWLTTHCVRDVAHVSALQFCQEM